MKSGPVVENLNVFEQFGPGLLPAVEPQHLDHLVLQRLEEAFHHRVVVAASFVVQIEGQVLTIDNISNRMKTFFGGLPGRWQDRLFR